jgi:hypothetical protein
MIVANAVNSQSVMMDNFSSSWRKKFLAKDEPQLCENCPLRMLLPDIKRRSWIQEPEKPSPMQLCRRLRAEARKYSTLSCPYYKNESLFFFMPSKAKEAWIRRAKAHGLNRFLSF